MVLLACGKSCIVLCCRTEHELTYRPTGFVAATTTHNRPHCVVKVSVLQTHNLLSCHSDSLLIHIFMTTIWRRHILLI